MRKIIYGICIIFYSIGFLILLKFLFFIQNLTFQSQYYTSLFPFFGLFLIGFYVSLIKIIQKLNQEQHKVTIGKVNKMLYLLFGTMILLLLSIKFSFNPYNFMVFLALAGYIISLISGYQLIKAEKVEDY